VWLPVQKELSLVETIMCMFNEKLSYKEVLGELKSLGVKNKTGRHFNKDSLKRLLTNKKYIGLMNVPGEDVFVKLPFGEVVSKDLFDEVQKNIERVESFKKINRNRRRIYILTGLLEFQDGSSFTGLSGTARS